MYKDFSVEKEIINLQKLYYKPNILRNANNWPGLLV